MFLLPVTGDIEPKADIMVNGHIMVNYHKFTLMSTCHVNILTSTKLSILFYLNLFDNSTGSHTWLFKDDIKFKILSIYYSNNMWHQNTTIAFKIILHQNIYHKFTLMPTCHVNILTSTKLIILFYLNLFDNSTLSHDCSKMISNSGY